jgi:hypothetical protein
MGQDVESRARYIGTLRSFPRRVHHPLVQTFPIWSVMHGRYEDITNVDFTLTEPSHMIGGKPEGGERWLAHCASRVEARYASITPLC